MADRRSGGAVGAARTDGEPLGSPFVLRWVQNLAAQVREQRDYLTQLDAAIGADHDINMDRGLAAAVAKVDGMHEELPGAILEAVGTTITLSVGGAAGPLYGTGFRGLGKALGRAPALRCRGSPGRSAGGSGRDREPGSGFGWRQDHRGRVRPRALGFRAVPPGQAGPGGRRGTGPGSRRGGDASDDPDAGSKGRASYPGPRSVGHQDPGASTALLFSALERAAGGLDRPSRERP